jgi:hypothetical protein
LRARAAGLLLEGKITGGEALRPIAEQTRDALVQLAAGAEDPAVYAMAVYVCDTYSNNPVNGACQQISLRAWAQMDAENAVPWLLLAGKARKENNTAAEADAYSQAAKAHKFDSYNDSLYAFSEAEMPKEVTPLERLYFATELIGIEAATRTPQYSVASRRCTMEAMQDSNVRQQCNALAELLVTNGRTLLDLGIGTAIGVRTGWSTERVNRLDQEWNALMQAIMQATPTGNDDLWTCNGVRLGNAYMGQRARLGELGAARDAVDRSGETLQELAQKHTEFVEKLRDALRQTHEGSAGSAP